MGFQFHSSSEACPGANEKLQVEGWFGQLADLNQDEQQIAVSLVFRWLS
jgi:hypothetical protein